MNFQFAKPVLFTLLLISFSGLNRAQGFEVLTDSSGMSTSFRGAVILKKNKAIVSGGHGTIGKTTDGGRTWNFTRIDSNIKSEFRDVEVAGNALFLLRVNEPAGILKSTDDGKTWNTKFSADEKEIFLDGMAWWNVKQGIVIGDPIDGRFVILLTDDGGETWNRLEPGNCPIALDGEAAFAASGSGIQTGRKGLVWFVSGGAHAYVLRSTDFGRSWTKHHTPVRSGTQSSGINSISFLDDRIGIIVGGDFSLPDKTDSVFAITSDGGLTWTMPVGKSPGGYRSCVKYVSNRILITTGINGTDISNDGGINWQRVGQGFHVIAMDKVGRFIVLAGKGKVGRLKRRKS